MSKSDADVQSVSKQESYDRFLLFMSCIFFGCFIIWLQAVMVFMPFETGHGLDGPLVAFGPCLIAVTAAPLICCARIPALRRRNPNFCSNKAFAIAAVLAIALAAVLYPAYLLPAPGNFAAVLVALLLIGVLVGITFQQWVHVWGGLFTIENKRTVYIGITVSLTISVLLFYLVSKFIPFSDAYYTVVFAHVMLLLALVGCRMMAHNLEGSYRELCIPPMSETSSDWNVGRGRPLANFNGGVAFAALVVLLCYTPVAPVSPEWLTACAFIGCLPLFFYAILAHSIPRISGVDRTVNLGFGISALLMLAGRDVLGQVGFHLLAVVATVCAISLISNMSLMVPCMRRSSEDACAKILTNMILGMLATSAAAGLLLVLGIDANMLLSLVCCFIVLLALLEPTFFPYRSDVVDTLHAFANGSDSIDSDLQAVRVGDEPIEPPAPSDADIQAKRRDLLIEKYSLSPREADVFMLLTHGHTADAIATKLFIATNTVKTHTYNIYHKIGVHSKQELIDLLDSPDLESR